MASARGDALDWALALARAPGERHALRQRPLPDGMETVLQIAGGHHATNIAEAAAHAGMAPAEVVEAARFYLREMLFFPEADPYRVLGLAADASDEQIKHHHRLLQQWLHPDRPTSDWDAAFAARVNAAWSQLRTPARREAHAARVGTVAPAAASEPSWSQPTRMHPVTMVTDGIDPGIDEGRWRRRAPVLALFGVCAVLGVLAVRDMQREPDRGLAGAEVVEQATPEDLPAVALQLPAPAAERAPPEKRVSAQKPPPQRVAAAPAPPVRPVPVAAKPAAKPVPPAALRPAAVAVASKPMPKPITPPARPTPPPPVAVVAAKPKVAPPKPLSTALARVPTRKPPVAFAAAVPLKPTAKTVPADTPVPIKPAAKTPIAVAPKTAVAPAVAAAKPVAAPPSKPAPVAVQPPAPKPTVVAAPAVATAPVAAPPPAANSPAQVAQAQQTGQRLLAYVSGRGGGVPPIWANVASQTQASRAREALQGAGRVDVGTPNWRVGDNSAAMQASLTPRDGDARRLRVDMVWREQRWLVTGLTLEQAL